MSSDENGVDGSGEAQGQILRVQALQMAVD